jgi:hypothetical protein
MQACIGAFQPKGGWGGGGDRRIGFERKVSFSYFRENFAKICFLFSRKKRSKVLAITFAKTKIFAKTDAGNENAGKHPNSKRQMKFRS